MVATVLLTSTTVLVMAEEFEQLPVSLQTISHTLVHNRASRNAFICGIILVMAIASSVGLDQSENQAKDDALVPGKNIRKVRLKEPLAINDTLEVNLNNPEQNIVLNLIVTATVHHITEKTDPNKQHCNTSCLKSLINNLSYKNLSNSIDNKTFYNSNRLKRSTGSTTTNFDKRSENINKCVHPEYIVFSWVLCLIALATALKLYYLIKTFLAVILVIVYTVFILKPFNELYNYPNTTATTEYVTH